jgi:hypothetical protein
MFDLHDVTFELLRGSYLLLLWHVHLKLIRDLALFMTPESESKRYLTRIFGKFKFDFGFDEYFPSLNSAL